MIFYFIDLKRQLGNSLLPNWKGQLGCQMNIEVVEEVDLKVSKNAIPSKQPLGDPDL